MTRRNLLPFVLFALLFFSCKQTNEQLMDKATEFAKEKKFNDAINILNKVISNNENIQLSYYNRGLCYLELKQYSKALADFNKILALQSNVNDESILVLNPNISDNSEVSKGNVSYFDALYLRAQTKYYMDSLPSSYKDFRICIDNGKEVSNCYLWQGTIFVRAGKQQDACKYFEKAKQIANKKVEIEEADRMLRVYCIK